MFEFVEKVATDMITSLGNTISQMSFDASSYDAQATENDAKAAQCEADASAEVASCPHYKSEPYETTDDDGNTVTKYEQVPDTAADAAAMARAATLRAEAANLKAIAAALRGLAAALRGTLFSMTSQQKQISQASQDSQFAIVATTKLLREGIDVTKRVIAAFNVPEASNFKEWTSAVGDNLLNAIGVDLSDGLNDEIYTAIGVVTTVGAIAGPLVVRRTTSIIGAKMGNGIIGNIGRYEANIVSEAIIKTYFNETGAKVAQNAIASALTFIGIDSLPTQGKKAVPNAATINGTEQDSKMTFEEAKTDAKEKYAKYVEKFNCYTEEQKKDLINKYNEQIDKAVVLSDEEFFRQLGEYNEGIVAYNNGAQDRVYIREGYANDPSVIIHEVGGHGTGTMSQTAGYYYTDPETGENVLYTGKYEDSPYKLTWKGNYNGIDEAATEYFARKINGEKWEDCAYNPSTDALQKITDSMTKYTGVNGEEVLMKTYTGENKDLFKNVYNESLTSVLWHMSDVKERLEFLVNAIKNITGLNNWGEYICRLFTIDAFFLNEDRHMHNIAVLMNGKGEYKYCPVFDNGAGLLSDTTMDYPMEQDIYQMISEVKSKSVSQNFDEQLDVAENLYGQNLQFLFTKKNVSDIVNNADMYPPEERKRVELIIYSQMNKYKYLFR